MNRRLKAASQYQWTTRSLQVQAHTFWCNVSSGYLPTFPGQSFANESHVVYCQDDIFIKGMSETEHLTNVDTMLKRILEFDLRICLDKCKFRVLFVTYWIESTSYRRKDACYPGYSSHSQCDRSQAFLCQVCAK